MKQYLRTMAAKTALFCAGLIGIAAALTVESGSIAEYAVQIGLGFVLFLYAIVSDRRMGMIARALICAMAGLAVALAIPLGPVMFMQIGLAIMMVALGLPDWFFAKKKKQAS